METNYNKIGEGMKEELHAMQEEFRNSITQEDTSAASVAKEEPIKEENLKIATVIPSNVNLREAGSKSADIICLLNSKEEVTIVKNKKSGWSQVIARNGISGYVMTEFLKEK